ncbi:MAG: ABC-ATPase UvrA [Candidatus Yonathbacteria bacterium RIFOXYD1_FULL_52_36]|uniref:UvrABC system protein A n=1 Tax=Candidatus Yonathbacteria bacterium RIFOXYD1_FULL_52_36 TaxID=1802730 RepID=A0A1G2SIY7_9BACT|nr:MAG: ABC-ATPase UvrA [Candidatus Yonathbacteria bacterium RIFOXYD1_FULL_52_36]
MKPSGKKGPSPIDHITVRGARTHNLKNITVSIPRNTMTVFTGLSGSGKSSLAFDTIFAEGQRRYVESLSAYARQFINQMQKPDVDEITGLSPAISIDQKSRSNNPRSTVATITEIYDYLRVLFARIGRPHCLTCGREIEKLSNEEILNFAVDHIKGAKAKGTKGALQIFAPIVRGRKGEYYQLLYDMLGKGYTHARVDGKVHSLREQIMLDKNKKHSIDVVIDEITQKEWSENPKTARERLAEAIERSTALAGGLVTVSLANDEFLLSSKFACPEDGFSYPEIEPRLFSFNSPYGACPTCNGLGTKHLFGDEPCEDCQGARLRKEALAVTIAGKNIVEIAGLSIEDAADFFKHAKLSAREKNISEVILKEITHRLNFMLDVGLDYLTLNRRANTLSGGEAQRIRLASQLGSRLVGALYVLDEPTIGLHQRDNDRLIKTLEGLRDLGNTIIVVEHDEDTILAADYLVDIGPGAGVHGGEVVVAGYTEELLTNKKHKSLTLDYLRGDRAIEIPPVRRAQDRGALKVRGAEVFNLKQLDADIPLGKLVVISGVSGSGKSTFLYEVLDKNLRAKLERRYRTNETFNVESFSGTEYISRVVLIDQSPIGRTPRSNPATYTGAFTFIRDLFAETEEARLRGWGPGRFSFNVKGGRCETCQGNGLIAVEMHFLPTVYVTCDVCEGKRFEKETLEVKYKKKSIYEVLHMTVEETYEFFQDIPAISDRLKTLVEVGLGYLELGQSATTLSGGEAQRVKISSELFRPHLEKTVYLLDEPTVGLHYEDVRKLVEILQKLVDKGHTVVVIEHNLDLVKCADYLLDFGPEGGDKGGVIVARGTPEQVAANPKSHTGKYLKRVLKK